MEQLSGKKSINRLTFKATPRFKKEIQQYPKSKKNKYHTGQIQALPQNLTRKQTHKA